MTKYCDTKPKVCDCRNKDCFLSDKKETTKSNTKKKKK